MDLNFPHLQDCYTVNLPISVSIGNKCVKGPCQDTIAALWACNVRPSIGTHWTIGALEGKKITTMLTLWLMARSQTENFLANLAVKKNTTCVCASDAKGPIHHCKTK